MEDRALMYALGEIITTVDKMRGTHTLNHLFTLRDILDKSNSSKQPGMMGDVVHKT